MKLLLFDIDGTLLRVHATSRKAVEYALQETFGRALAVEGISFSGKTDPQILEEILHYHGYDLPHKDPRFQQVLRLYTETFLEQLCSEDVQVLPGVVQLLEQLAQDENLVMGLLTGNLEPTAYHKLAHAGLDDFFTFGAFGSDHHNRNQLPAIAVERAQAVTNHRFKGQEVVIIGDTHHDICCGRGIGARSVAVCTGRIGREQLVAEKPDILLEDLSCCQTFVETVLG